MSTPFAARGTTKAVGGDLDSGVLHLVAIAGADDPTILDSVESRVDDDRFERDLTTFVERLGLHQAPFGLSYDPDAPDALRDLTQTTRALANVGVEPRIVEPRNRMARRLSDLDADLAPDDAPPALTAAICAGQISSGRRASAGAAGEELADVPTRPARPSRASTRARADAAETLDAATATIRARLGGAERELAALQERGDTERTGWIAEKRQINETLAEERKQSSDLAATAERRQARVEELESTVNQLSTRLADEQQHLLGLRGDHADLAARFDTMRSETEALREQLDETSRAMRTADRKLGNKTLELTAAKANVERLRTEKRDGDTRRKQSEDDHEKQAADRAADHAAAIAELEERLSEERTIELEALQARLDTAEAEHERDREEVEARHQKVLTALAERSEEQVAEATAAANASEEAREAEVARVRSDLEGRIDEQGSRYRAELETLRVSSGDDRKQLEADLQALREVQEQSLDELRRAADGDLTEPTTEAGRLVQRLAAETETRSDEEKSSRRALEERLKAEHERALKALRNEHRDALDEMTQERDDAIAELATEHEQRLADASVDRDKELQRLGREFDDDYRDELRKEFGADHEAALSGAEERHRSEVADLVEAHRSELASLREDKASEAAQQVDHRLAADAAVIEGLRTRVAEQQTQIDSHDTTVEELRAQQSLDVNAVADRHSAALRDLASQHATQRVNEIRRLEAEHLAEAEANTERIKELTREAAKAQRDRDAALQELSSEYTAIESERFTEVERIRDEQATELAALRNRVQQLTANQRIELGEARDELTRAHEQETGKLLDNFDIERERTHAQHQSELERLRRELSSVHDRLQGQHQDRLAQLTADFEATHKADLTRVEGASDARVRSLTERLQAEREADLEDLELSHAAELKTAQAERELEVTELTQRHEEATTLAEERHIEELAVQRERHDEEREALNRDYQNEVARRSEELRGQRDGQVAALRNQHDSALVHVRDEARRTIEHAEAETEASTAKLRSEHKTELEALEQKRVDDLAEQRTRHQGELRTRLDQLGQELRTEKQEVLDRWKLEHDSELRQLKAHHERDVDALEKAHSAELEKRETTRSAEAKRLRDAAANATSRRETDVSRLSDEVERRTAEREAMARSHEQAMTDAADEAAAESVRLQSVHEAEIEVLQAEHTSRLETIASQHADRLDDLEDRHREQLNAAEAAGLREAKTVEKEISVELETALARLAHVDDARKRQAETMAELESQIADMTVTIADLTATRDELVADLNEAEAYTDVAGDEERLRLEGELSAAQARLGELDAEIISLTGRIRTAERRSTTDVAKIAELQGKIDAAAESEIRRVAAAFNSASRLGDRAVVESETRITELQLIIETQEATIERLQGQGDS